MMRAKQIHHNSFPKNTHTHSFLFFFFILKFTSKLNPTSKPLSAQQQQQQQQQQQFKDFKQNQTRKSLTKNLEFQSPMFYQLVSRAWNERDSSLPHTFFFFFFFFFLINQNTHTHTHTRNKRIHSKL
jgi:hypothetical protein